VGSFSSLSFCCLFVCCLVLLCACMHADCLLPGFRRLFTHCHSLSLKILSLTQSFSFFLSKIF
jgi:hypothetical protein